MARFTHPLIPAQAGKSLGAVLPVLGDPGSALPLRYGLTGMTAFGI
ncbi:hypothetical protein [Gracilimonas mengyeensis]|nr:hypothetical protein [Gracilimonas mengyeensis]